MLFFSSAFTTRSVYSFRKHCTKHLCGMANPLIAVCQMTSTNDKEKNLQTVTELAAKAKSRSACVSTKTFNCINIKLF